VHQREEHNGETRLKLGVVGMRPIDWIRESKSLLTAIKQYDA
jgi:hypothetical protein